ncbi:MAG: Mov34/MPN/PAD-1 family protein [Acidimicrobiales bacterium]
MSPVHRVTPLPTGAQRGRLIVAASVLEFTQKALSQSETKEPHESLVWWLGRQVDRDTIVLASIRPRVTSTSQSVFVDEIDAGFASRRAREYGLGVVAQLHTHPGSDTRHSDGDDLLIFMPFEGMFSLVVADYGHGRLNLPEGFSTHQFQDGRWVLLDQTTSSLTVVPAEVAL